MKRLAPGAVGLMVACGIAAGLLDAAVSVPVRGQTLACRTIELGHVVCDSTVTPAAQQAAAQAATAIDPGFAALVLTAAAPRLAIAATYPTKVLPLPSWLPPGVLLWEAEITAAANRAGLDPLALAGLVAIECASGNASGCVSNKGAMGLTQVMPGTAVEIESATGLPCSSGAYDPVTSLDCGAWYYVQRLRSCASVWREDEELPALLCAGHGYSAGPGTIPGYLARLAAGVPPVEAGSNSETASWLSQFASTWTRAGRR